MNVQRSEINASPTLFRERHKYFQFVCKDFLSIFLKIFNLQDILYIREAIHFILIQIKFDKY